MTIAKYLLYLYLSAGLYLKSTAQTNLWKLRNDGSIIWNVTYNMPHSDHVEMSGKQMSAVITYGCDNEKKLVLQRRVFFPLLRTIPNDTRASLSYIFDDQNKPSLKINGELVSENPISFVHNGTLEITSLCAQGIEIKRILIPSTDKPLLTELVTVRNLAQNAITLTVPKYNLDFKTDKKKGVYGSYIINRCVYNDTTIMLSVNSSYSYSEVFSARKENEPIVYYSANYELIKRNQFLNELRNNLVFKTPDKNLNALFDFAKIRATESIYDTKGGLMHGPGGSNYYAALWANDQGEFTSPFFPYLGNINGNESAINCYRQFARFINTEYKRLPSSIIAEGDSTWNWGETKYGDRGDAAMLLYGGSRFALAYADTSVAQQLWPLIKWCAEYTLKRKTIEGIIASETDGEEGRFKTGSANLYVNSLAYNGFIMAGRLANSLGYKESTYYLKIADELKNAIERYFSSKIINFDTYKYFKEGSTLYGWIGLPLAMGLTNKVEQTQKALFSPLMWKNNVILSESGNNDRYFERPMLNSFRGLFYSGFNIDTTLSYFQKYSTMRLLGPHVPYIVEAYPEGNGRQLAGDNALYCRIITEGIFGLEPQSFNTFFIAPRLPKSWNEMSLKHIRAFNSDVNIFVRRFKNLTKVSVFNNGKLIKEMLWDGKKPIEINLK